MERIKWALPTTPPQFEHPILGISAAIRDVERLIHRLAQVKSSVLITGETGVGKDVCARLLHQLSKSRKHPFMAVNCAAIPEQLLESEIFGHEAGSFTSASKRHLGYAERAGEGTLFLDEIGELPLAMQAKLLRLLEERTFQRVGGETTLPFKARVVCATNSNLERLVLQGRFRADLYYRINVVEVRVPPLRERAEDIPWFMDKFFSELVASGNGSARGISSFVNEISRTHTWPGNVRELKNRIERAAALSLNEVLMPVDLFPEYSQPVSMTESVLLSLAQVRDAAEKHEIARVLTKCEGQPSKAAAILGISRTTLWEKMKRFGLCDI